MHITVNGKQIEAQYGMTIAQLLTDQKVTTPQYVSVELNGNILDRNEFETTLISKGDSVEFLYFMGGGAA